MLLLLGVSPCAHSRALRCGFKHTFGATFLDAARNVLHPLHHVITSNVYAAVAAVPAGRDRARPALHLRRRAAGRFPCRVKSRHARIPAAARAGRRGAPSILADGSQAFGRQVPEAAASALQVRQIDLSSLCASPGRLSRLHAFCSCPFPAPGRHVENLRRDAAAPQHSAAFARETDFRRRGRD